MLDSIGADFILFDRAVPDMFHFKHNTGASNVMIFIGNPNVDSLSVVNNAFPVLTKSNAATRLQYWVVSLLTNRLIDLVSTADPSYKKE